MDLGSAKPKIIFLAALSHSGSTLLDLMLNAHRDVTSVGELKQLARFASLQKRRPCACGAATLWDCDFWTRVNELIVAKAGRTIADLNVGNYEDVERFNTDNIVLFDSIRAVARTKFIVDSSKHLRRLELLTQNEALEVFPIFLIRDPKGQICSSLRKDRNTLLRLVADYVGTNRSIYSYLKDRPHVIVRYEELVNDAERTLVRIMQYLGVAFEPLQLRWAMQERHNVGGNRMRWNSSSDLRLDAAWRTELSLMQKLAIDAGTIPGRYSFVRLTGMIGRR
jgi:Sulfotransferase family